MLKNSSVFHRCRQIPEEQQLPKMDQAGTAAHCSYCSQGCCYYRQALLLVEDNEINCKIAAFLLQDKGAEVAVAKNGQVALDMFLANPAGTYDAILMDVIMPVMEGYAATKQIRAAARQDAKTIPIIAMTANAFREDSPKYIVAGMNAHFVKPINVEALMEAPSKYLT